MALVSINVYDITNTPNSHANEAIKTLNRFTRDTFGVGGIFHGAVEVNGEEWSFGYCPYGTGVYSCTPKGNPNYTFRESIPLGVTSISQAQFRRSIDGLQDEWQGWTYDLLSRNCNHFCESLVEILGVGPLPAWVNRFAVNADYALETSQTALTEVKKVWKSSADTLQLAAGWLKDHLVIDPAVIGHPFGIPGPGQSQEDKEKEEKERNKPPQRSVSARRSSGEAGHSNANGNVRRGQSASGIAS